MATQQICIFDIISRLQFLFHHKKMWSILESHKIEMAEQNRALAYFREYTGRERARALMEAIEDARRRREEGRGSSSPPTQQGRAGALNMIRSVVERHLGGLSMWLVRGRDLPLHSPTLSTPSQPGGRGRGRALSPPSSPPIKDHLPSVKVGRFQHVGPLRCPSTLP